MRWSKTPVVGEIRERVVFLWLPKRFYRRSKSFYYEDNGESIVLWLEPVYIVERWSYKSADWGIVHNNRNTSVSKCYWRTEAWRVLK